MLTCHHVLSVFNFYWICYTAWTVWYVAWLPSKSWSRRNCQPALKLQKNAAKKQILYGTSSTQNFCFVFAAVKLRRTLSAQMECDTAMFKSIQHRRTEFSVWHHRRTIDISSRCHVTTRHTWSSNHGTLLPALFSRWCRWPVSGRRIIRHHRTRRHGQSGWSNNQRNETQAIHDRSPQLNYQNRTKNQLLM